jgi:hypothetical protein
LLRARFGAQQEAAAEFFDAAARAARLRVELDALDRKKDEHAAALAETLNVSTDAEVTGSSRTRIAEALKSQRPRSPQPAGAAALSPNGEA